MACLCLLPTGELNHLKSPYFSSFCWNLVHWCASSSLFQKCPCVGFWPIEEGGGLVYWKIRVNSEQQAVSCRLWLCWADFPFQTTIIISLYNTSQHLMHLSIFVLNRFQTYILKNQTPPAAAIKISITAMVTHAVGTSVGRNKRSRLFNTQ